MAPLPGRSGLQRAARGCVDRSAASVPRPRSEPAADSRPVRREFEIIPAADGRSRSGAVRHPDRFGVAAGRILARWGGVTGAKGGAAENGPRTLPPVADHHPARLPSRPGRETHKWGIYGDSGGVPPVGGKRVRQYRRFPAFLGEPATSAIPKGYSP